MLGKIKPNVLLPSFKYFMQKGKDAFNGKKFYEAYTNFNVAKKILGDLVALRATIDNTDVEELNAFLAEIGPNAAKKDEAISHLSRLKTAGAAATHAPKKKIKTLSLFLFGLDAAGKTTFVDYVIQEKFLDHLPTVGVSITNIMLGNVNFIFEDLGGQEAYRVNWKNYWRDPDFMLFMVDATDATRFPEAREYLWSVIKSSESAKIPLAVISSKNDLPEAVNIENIQDALDLWNIKDRLFGMFEISVKNKTNIEKVLNFIASQTLSDQAMRKFVDEEVDRLNRNYKELYKAYIEEAESLKAEKNYKVAIDRVYKAKVIQEELFKQGFSKAQKKIAKCNALLSSLINLTN
ncbi:MAG TPA: ADP-ribosylation factor-like protein [Candidatus Lokiarchaeia archaeon]|nr:ADP-ribosylation factor-like protein [Candidatus Lokiarchaeia archaeon]